MRREIYNIIYRNYKNLEIFFIDPYVQAILITSFVIILLILLQIGLLPFVFNDNKPLNLISRLKILGIQYFKFFLPLSIIYIFCSSLELNSDYFILIIFIIIIFIYLILKYNYYKKLYIKTYL